MKNIQVGQKGENIAQNYLLKKGYKIIEANKRFSRFCEIDLIAEDIMLPELEIGDLIVGRMMGAYTISTSTEFNFIDRTPILVIDSDNNIEELQKYKKVA